MEINRLAPSWLMLPMGGLPRPIVGLIGVHLPEIQHLTQNRSESLSESQLLPQEARRHISAKGD